MEDGGEFHTPLRGIPRGSALSPLLAAFHLTETDNVFSRNRHVTYARYMDDFLILSPTRWHLRRAVSMLNRHFAQAGFEQHPDKTFIGRVEKGFDWMGFWFTEKGCDGVAPRALQNFKDRLRRLYERVRQWPEDLRHRRMAGYVRAWDSGLRRRGATASHPVHYKILRTDSAGFMSGSGSGLKTSGTAGWRGTSARGTVGLHRVCSRDVMSTPRFATATAALSSHWSHATYCAYM
ncbi:reverse transcriptase domain-containing protein [Salmonella enterica]|uniref:reverse transcriptase domain-containing protein n=1 Tax=Salmonella enterica TaxID=28901 RepID=UPI003918B2D7